MVKKFDVESLIPITYLLSTSEVDGSNSRPDLMWESLQLLTNAQRFTVQNLDQVCTGLLCPKTARVI